jgi:YggT family protein
VITFPENRPLPKWPDRLQTLAETRHLGPPPWPVNNLACAPRRACSRRRCPLHLRWVGDPSETTMRALFIVIYEALELYKWLVIAWVIMSWLIAFNVVNTRNQFAAMVADFLYRITEPALRPIRKAMPNLGSIDISPVILFFVIYFLQLVIQMYIIPNVP